jgi:hypothetical protein
MIFQRFGDCLRLHHQGLTSRSETLETHSILTTDRLRRQQHHIHGSLRQEYAKRSSFLLVTIVLRDIHQKLDTEIQEANK